MHDNIDSLVFIVFYSNKNNTCKYILLISEYCAFRKLLKNFNGNMLRICLTD